MVYCTVAEVASVIPQYDQAGWPAVLDATQEVAEIDATIDVILAARGLATPFVSNGDNDQDAFANLLKHICKQGGAYRVVRSLFPEATGAGETPAWAEFKAAYMAGKKGLIDGSLIPRSVLSADDQVVPSNVGTLHPDDVVNDSLGTEHKHAFTRAKRTEF